MRKKSIWNQPAPAAAEPEPKPQPAEAQSAEEVAAATREKLAAQGWCLLRCSTLGGDVIVVTIDETVTGYPTGYPVYLAQELSEILPLDNKMLRLAHEAKKLTGAKIEAVVTAGKD